MPHAITTLAFDVFGTVVDWRTSIAREASAFLRAIGRDDIDPARFADKWRGLYRPSMEPCLSGERPFTILDQLHLETLKQLLAHYEIDQRSIADDRIHSMALAWRRLDPWPDVLPGMARLRACYPLIALSNGNIALILEMARRGGFIWDAILGAEVTRHYKPDPHAYLATADLLGIPPEALCLVAAHHSDLAAARACGLSTAFVARPMEYGGRPAPDAAARQDWDFAATSFVDLADQIAI